MSLPFEPESFDLVVCQFGVMFFDPKPGRSLHRSAPILRPGGRFLFSVWDGLDDNEFPAVVSRRRQRVPGRSAPVHRANTARLPRSQPDRVRPRAGGFVAAPSFDASSSGAGPRHPSWSRARSARALRYAARSKRAAPGGSPRRSRLSSHARATVRNGRSRRPHQRPGRHRRQAANAIASPVLHVGERGREPRTRLRQVARADLQRRAAVHVGAGERAACTERCVVHLDGAEREGRELRHGLGSRSDRAVADAGAGERAAASGPDTELFTLEWFVVSVMLTLVDVAVTLMLNRILSPRVQGLAVEAETVVDLDDGSRSSGLRRGTARRRPRW